MKILYLTHHWTSNSHHSKFSGYQRIVPFMAKRGHDVTLVSWGMKDEVYEEDGYQVILKQTSGKKDFLKNRLLLSKYAASIYKDYDIIHALYSDCGYYLPKKANFLTTIHITPGTAKYKGFINKAFLSLKAFALEKKVLNNAAKIICVSTNLVKDLERNYAEKLVYVPHGIDTDFWRPVPLNMPIRATLLGNKFKQIAICVGINGVSVPILEKTVQKLTDTLFILVGNTLEKEYANLISKKGISDEELRDLYQVADVYFRPVNFATANNSLMEAMAVGKPIVISKVEGITDYIDEETAFFVDPSAAFYKKLQVALESDDKEKKAEKARALALERFSWDVIARQLEQQYHDIISHNL